MKGVDPRSGRNSLRSRSSTRSDRPTPAPRSATSVGSSGGVTPPSTPGKRSTPISGSANSVDCARWKKRMSASNAWWQTSRSTSTCCRRRSERSLRPARRRELADWFRDTFQVSCLRACRLAQFSRAAWYRRSRAKDQSVLRLRLRDLAHTRPRFGYLRIWVVLRREGWPVNRTRVRRLYRLEGLQLRMRVRRRTHLALHRGPAPVPVGPTERWSMDFVHDTLADGRPFRILTVVDNWRRQSPVLEAGFRMSGARVGDTLDGVLSGEQGPRSITVNHGTEFQSRALEDWAYRRGVQLDFLRSGKPAENAFIESCNGRLRDECLNVHQFASLDEARTIIEAWRL
ncbi:MAG TPA: IS3 family transposase, partial [Blastocatellia bacterium]|nr:IS3 family transposase [Blastocatellia bacterium]